MLLASDLIEVKSEDSIISALQDIYLGVETALDIAPVGLCVLDLSFRYLTVNARFAQMFGLAKADFLGRTVQEALPGPASQIVISIQEALDAHAIIEREIVLPNPLPKRGLNDSDDVTYLCTSQPIRNTDGDVYAVAVALSDITARKQAENNLRDIEGDLRYTIELTPHLPWRADASGELTFMSDRWHTLTGTTGPVHIKEWADVLHPDDLAATEGIWSKCVTTGEPYDTEYRIRTANGDWSWVRARAYPRRNESGEIIRWYGSVEDVQDRKLIAIRLQQATRTLALRALGDHLTGLPNRRLFDEVLTREIDRARRSKVPIALILLDIDHFKRYNDVGGHLLGDECLRAVALTIHNGVHRPADFSARFGGEEFAVLLPDTPLVGAVEVARSILASVRGLAFSHPDSRVQRVTLSAGVSVIISADYPVTSIAVTELIESADKALYLAKARGRDCVVS